MSELTGQEVRAIVMKENDSGQTTIGGYLKKLLSNVWEEGESFSGKRPFGNSGWEHDLYSALAEAGVISCSKEQDADYVNYYDYDTKKADNLIFRAINSF